MIEKPVPIEVDFPAFPALSEYTRTENGVLVPAQWIIDLAHFQIDYEQTQKIYQSAREIYSEQN